MENAELTRVPNYEEIKDVVMKLNSNKSPGPDGFNGMFFQKYWHIIGMDMVKAIQHIFHGNGMLRQVNHTFLTLIPKIQGASDLTDFRPISCVNTTYKVLSKLIEN